MFIKCQAGMGNTATCSHTLFSTDNRCVGLTLPAPYDRNDYVYRPGRRLNKQCRGGESRPDTRKKKNGAKEVIG